MDQLIQAIGLNQGRAVPGAPSPITGQELLLRALGAALPPPLDSFASLPLELAVQQALSLE